MYTSRGRLFGPAGNPVTRLFTGFALTYFHFFPQDYNGVQSAMSSQVYFYIFVHFRYQSKLGGQIFLPGQGVRLSHWGKPEKPTGIFRREATEFGEWYIHEASDLLGCVEEMGRFVPLASERLGRQVGTVGL